MIEFRRQLEKRLREAVPDLKGIQIGAVEAETRAPFAVYSIKEEPVRSKGGIAGYLTTLELSVYHINSKALETLKRDIVLALDRTILDDRRLTYRGGEYGFYEDAKTMLNGYTLTFKIR